MNTLVVNGIGREKRYALLRNQKLEKLMIEQPKQQSLVGGIYYGFVEKVLPGMNAAFINIGLEKNGFLHRNKLPLFGEDKEAKSISAFLHQGQKLLVQVEKDATGDKGPRLTAIIEFNGRMTVYSPQGHYIAVSKKMGNPQTREKWRTFGLGLKQGDEGILFRTSCEDHTEDEVLSELTMLREQYEGIFHSTKTMKKPGLIYEKNSFFEEIKEEVIRMDSGKVLVDTFEMKKELTALNHRVEVLFHQEKENIFSTYRLEHELENALKRVVWLENGAYLVFDEAEALTVIDVNTGKFSGGHELQDTVMKTNEMAAKEIARQIRLRDLAGMILVDFIDMQSGHERERVKRSFEVALGFDDKRTRIVGFTPLGVLQMTRKRLKVSISEALTKKCHICDGTGKVLSAETIAFQLERELLEQRGRDEEAILVETTEEVKKIFAGEQSIHQLKIEEMVGMNIYFSIHHGAKPYYVIRQMGTSTEIREKAN